MTYPEQDKKFPRPMDFVTMCYQIIVIFLILFNFRAVHNAFLFILYHILVVIFLLWLAWSNDTPLFRWLKNWNPVILVPVNYSELRYLVHNVHPKDYDSLLTQIDYRLFSVHPTVWMEKWTNPWLTEYMQVIYTTFYFLPFILAIYLLKKNKVEEFRYFIFIIVVGYYASYLGYFSVPALGPRFTLDHLQTVPLTGIWIAEILRDVLNRLESIQRDAFPSGHTAITLLTMIYAWKYWKTYFWILALVGTSLIFSTVYLRYHYVIDVVAGIALTGLVVAVSPYLYRKLLELPALISKKVIFLRTSTEDEQL